MNTGFVFPREICPFVDGFVAAVAVRSVVQRRVKGAFVDADEALLRLYGMDPKEMQGYCVEAYKDVQRSNRTYRENRLRRRLEDKLEGARREVAMERRSLDALTQRVVNFERTPLWRRLWIAYKGRLS